MLAQKRGLLICKEFDLFVEPCQVGSNFEALD